MFEVESNQQSQFGNEDTNLISQSKGTSIGDETTSFEYCHKQSFMQDFNTRDARKEIQTRVLSENLCEALNQKLSLISLMEASCFTSVLSFLDVESLNKFANVNSRTRLRVRSHFMTHTFLKDIKRFDSEEKTVLFETMVTHLKSKIKFFYSSRCISEQELYSLTVEEHSIQLMILQNELNDKGANLTELVEVIPFIQKKGMKETFADVFSLYECDYSSSIRQDCQNVEYSQCSTISRELNSFFLLLQEQRAIRSVFKFDDDELNEKVMIRKIIRYLNWRGYERIRPSVIKRIETQKFQKQKSIYSYLNKNTLSAILPFLSIKEIFNIKRTSKQMSSLIDLTLENHIHNLIQTKQQFIEENGIEISLINSAELFTYYLVLNTLVQEAFQIEVILVSNLEIIVSLLNYLTEQNQRCIDLGQEFTWEYIMERTESVHAQFIQQFIPSQQASATGNTSQGETMQNEEPALFFYQDSEEYSIITSSLKSLSYQLKRNLEVDPSFTKYLSYYLKHFFQMNKEIILLQKIQNKNIIIPPLYSNFIFENLVASYSYQYSPNDMNEEQYDNNDGGEEEYNDEQEEEQEEENDENEEEQNEDEENGNDEGQDEQVEEDNNNNQENNNNVDIEDQEEGAGAKQLGEEQDIDKNEQEEEDNNLMKEENIEEDTNQQNKIEEESE